MKTTTIIGTVITVLLIGTLATMFMLNRMAPKVQKNAQAWIDTNVPVIIKDWNSEELIKRASPGLLKAASHEQFSALFTTLADKLGPLREYKGSKGGTTVSLWFTGITKNGTYEPEALFTQAPAVILCRISWLDGGWKIDEFRVKSDALHP
jgi:hypothetical protein